MKPTIKSELVYTLNLGGKDHPGFRAESRWEGFVKLTDGKHTVIAQENWKLSDFFGLGHDHELTIISCSPSLYARGGIVE